MKEKFVSFLIKRQFSALMFEAHEWQNSVKFLIFHSKYKLKIPFFTNMYFFYKIRIFVTFQCLFYLLTIQKETSAEISQAPFGIVNNQQKFL